MDIRRLDTGIYTVEGAVSGSRAARLTAEREKQVEQYNASKSEIQAKNKVSAFGSKFSAASSGAEAELRSRTVGLLSADEYAVAVGQAESLQATGASGITQAQAAATAASQSKDSKPAAATGGKKRPRPKTVLSFSMDDDGDEGGEEGGGDTSNSFSAKKSSAGTGIETGAGSSGNGNAAAVLVKKTKDPTASTSFLPDRERDAAIEHAKAALRQEWLAEQETIKSQKLEVVYSYWDGSGHRKNLTVTKGATIEEFLIAVKEQCIDEFRDLRSCSADSLMYIKEDLVIPHHLSFYDLIVTKARGKSGPLFHFDVHDDIRLRSDATIEKDESHPGKICQRSWYERNKHIFPASRWEVYDPAVKREGYTIHDMKKS